MSDETKALTVDPSKIPAHLRDRGKSAARNAEALAGLSGGGIASIRIKNGRFRIKEVGSEDVAIPVKELAEGQYLPVVITGVRGPLNKTYFATAYDPNQDENHPPDCFSLDGEKPDPTVENPICSNCAGCPMNAFGTGKNQAGQPTKGKACADNKVIAVYYRNKIYSLKIPPASLKNFATYVRELDRHDLDYASVITFISLDDTADYIVLTFRVGGYLSEENLTKVDELCESHETHEIMNPKPFVKQIEHNPGDENPQSKPAKKDEPEEAEYEDEPEDEPAPKKKAAPKKAAKKTEPEDDGPALPSTGDINDILGL